jgi:hypothetical protein
MYLYRENKDKEREWRGSIVAVTAEWERKGEGPKKDDSKKLRLQSLNL